MKQAKIPKSVKTVDDLLIQLSNEPDFIDRLCRDLKLNKRNMVDVLCIWTDKDGA